VGCSNGAHRIAQRHAAAGRSRGGSGNSGSVATYLVLARRPRGSALGLVLLQALEALSDEGRVVGHLLAGCALQRRSEARLHLGAGVPRSGQAVDALLGVLRLLEQRGQALRLAAARPGLGGRRSRSAALTASRGEAKVKGGGDGRSTRVSAWPLRCGGSCCCSRSGGLALLARLLLGRRWATLAWLADFGLLLLLLPAEACRLGPRALALHALVPVFVHTAAVAAGGGAAGGAGRAALAPCSGCPCRSLAALVLAPAARLAVLPVPGLARGAGVADAGQQPRAQLCNAAASVGAAAAGRSTAAAAAQGEGGASKPLIVLAVAPAAAPAVAGVIIIIV
jgi:hypothetical protein